MEVLTPTKTDSHNVVLSLLLIPVLILGSDFSNAINYKRPLSSRMPRCCDFRSNLKSSQSWLTCFVHPRNRQAPWVSFIVPFTNTSNRLQHLGSGWGAFERYSWKEDDEKLYIISTINRNLTTDDLVIDIKPDSLHVQVKGDKVPIISGQTRGKVDVDETFWILEDKGTFKQIQITLQKGDTTKQTWFGVIVGDGGSVYYDNNNVLMEQQRFNIEPRGVFWSKTFSSLTAQRLDEMFKRWIKRESDALIPFGKPKLDINFYYEPADIGGRLMFGGLDIEVDEFFEVVVEPKGDNCTMVILNSNTTKILSGEYGQEASNKLKFCMSKLLHSFETDLEKLVALWFVAMPINIMCSNAKDGSTTSKYDYAGSNAFIGPNTLEQYEKYHENLKKSMGQPVNQKTTTQQGVFKDNKLGVVIDWDATNDTNENLNAKKKLINELTEAIKHTKQQQPIETVKSLASNLRKHLSLSQVEFDQLLQNASLRVSQETDQLDQRQQETSNMDLSTFPDPVFNYLASEIDTKPPSDKTQAPAENKEAASENVPESQTPNIDTFDAIMEQQEHFLSRKYQRINKYHQSQLRARWKRNVCSNKKYKPRDLLISEDYPTLMKSFLDNMGSKMDEEQRRKLSFLNEFVLSLYKDAEIYTCQDEKKQLAKIKQICDWAKNDFEKINDMVEANKKLYDVNFLTYLRLAISQEMERVRHSIGIETVDFTPDPYKNPWLCILTIIERAVTSLIEADMAEDVYHIGVIVAHENPSVRSYMLEFIIATMPRSDWKAFKNLIVSTANALLRRHDNKQHGDLPQHFKEACIQLKDDIERMIPDWVIDDMLSEDDCKFMYVNNVGQSLTWPILQLRKSPVLQLDLSYLEKKYKGLKDMQLPPNIPKLAQTFADQHTIKQHD
ncbi:bifunctional CS domain/HSP20-like chaperone [Babesia duncani]|uniref:NudC domain-containing protein 1 n=1 Tax=Babesia duncani TaxID=323732 RepID=A0AAD9PNS5_9APIC|nr:bifunctional CS domain/HSP20-like chaperone [Babesia duncani]